MFLKSLTLKGFKSFADATTLELEPGITVVVGPNGSGKSNVVDAVAWVLGAQGPRTMRSSKMEDVIFAGTAGRPALGRAEVSLTIDNSDSALGDGFAEITITRTLFRSGDSEYFVNGVPCRLLDVQELLSDSGVGRQQHVIVSQGQLDAVLNARPEERRMVIEEAAGVLKYRKRKEKAERRLAATEGNVLRLNDLLREVRRQLRPLERQADAARRHGGLVTELVELRRFVGGRELADLRARGEAQARRRVELADRELALSGELGSLDAEVARAESDLGHLAAVGPADGHGGQGPSGHGGDPSEALLRHEGLRERARGLLAVLAERRRGIDRDVAALDDRGLVATLETESNRLAGELADLHTEHLALTALGRTLAEAEASLTAEQEAFEERWGDGSAEALPTGAAEARGELAALRASAGRRAEEIGRLESRLAALEQKEARLRAEGERLRAAVAEAGAARLPLVSGAEAAHLRRAEAESAQAGAEEALRTQQGEWHAWTGRADALALALDQARARAGAERLAELDGVLGTLLELVEVDEGWQSAFEAAAGEAIAAVVVDGVDGARRALAALHDAGCSGAVLPAPGRAIAAPPGGTLAPGAQPVRPHVRSDRPGVERLLDSLLGAAVAVEGRWEAAFDLAVARPGLVVVTFEGHRFAAGGWRAAASGTGATGAALEEARRKAAAAALGLPEAEARVRGAGEALAAARRAESEAVRSLGEHETRSAAAAVALQRIDADGRDVGVEVVAVRGQLAELAGRVSAEDERIAELEAVLPAMVADEEAVAARAEAVSQARRRLSEHTATVEGMRTSFELRSAGLEGRRQLLARRRVEVDDRLAQERVRAAEGARRVDRLVATAAVTDRLTAHVAGRLTVVEAELAELRELRRLQTERTRAVVDRLAGLRRRRAEGEGRLTELRDLTRQTELAVAELRLRLETATETLRRELDIEPEQAVAQPCPPLPPGAGATSRLLELERELRMMGPINPLALEEHAELQERLQFLEAQLEDVRASRRELAKVIRAIDAEIVEVFAAAYADVSGHFNALFATLFPGGTGRLRLTTPDNLLETGVEVEARPSGKNVRQLSLLSGGERSLTALAFLFAVFRSRPSPFYLMDEVEAALDDINLHRFLDLVAEFRQEAQLIIVSHQKRTMEAADCLYGVTMQPGGSSRVVSQRVAAGT